MAYIFFISYSLARSFALRESFCCNHLVVDVFCVISTTITTTSERENEQQQQDKWITIKNNKRIAFNIFFMSFFSIEKKMLYFLRSVRKRNLNDFCPYMVNIYITQFPFQGIDFKKNDLFLKLKKNSFFVLSSIRAYLETHVATSLRPFSSPFEEKPPNLFSVWWWQINEAPRK